MSATLAELAESLPEEGLNLRFLIQRIGEEGLLVTCMFLTLPFLLPVSIPGVSTAFGLLIVLISVGIVANRVPWLPKRLLDRPMSREQTIGLLKKGSDMLRRLERLVRPRWLVFSAGALMHRLNGLGLIVSGVLLMMPFGLIPFSNTLPGLAILFLAAGLLQRDGYFILAGYAAIVATIVYFSFLVGLAVMTGKGVASLFGNAVTPPVP